MEIAEAGGITAAEARLGKGKSAISLGLSRLEERLAIRLCERGRSGFRLTEQGQLVHSAAVQLLAEIGRFQDFVGAAMPRLEDKITFVADDSFLFEFSSPLSRAISSITDLYPALKLNIRMTSPDQIYLSILEGSADIGFTTLSRFTDALIATPVCTETMGIFCGRDHPIFGVEDHELRAEDVQSHGFVASEVMHDHAFTEFMRGVQVKATAPTILSRMLLVLSSRYLGVIPIAFAQQFVAVGDIRELRFEGSRTVNTCYLVHRRARSLGLGGTIFRRMLLDEIARAAPPVGHPV